VGWLTDVADLLISMAFNGKAGLCSFLAGFLTCAGGCNTVGTAKRERREEVMRIVGGFLEIF